MILKLKNLKRLSLLFLGASFILNPLFLSCKAQKVQNNDRNKIVSTIFPFYDWAGNIIGKNDEKTINTLIIKSGSGIHDFQPSQSDISQIVNADIFIYNGNQIDFWAEEILRQKANQNMTVLNLSDITSVERLSSSSENHLWLSLRNAEVCVQAISDALCAKIPEMAEIFSQNCSEYIEEIELLDSSFKSSLSKYTRKSLIHCDEFPFAPLAQDYNLNFLSAYSTCPAPAATAESLTAPNIQPLADALSKEEAKALLVLENSDKKISKAVILEAKRPSCDTFVLDSMEHTTLWEAFKGRSYLGIMRENLETMEKSWHN